ncbi:pupal cuticle protein 36a-like [Sabethes cyaneus]|uniref:pupal cuticle protein 36a-like n=1 Tax=Sabethes cyaneus TaxID=53552 RepID=UPI00237DFBB0|nr:pupal cuticle protein 36a-like [Sabethes cyaneus]
MKFVILLAVLGCALAQGQELRGSDGRYYPELYQGKWNDGKYRPDNSGAYRPDGSGQYSGKYVPYVDSKYGVGGQGGAGGFGGQGGRVGGSGGRGGAGSGGGVGSGSGFGSGAGKGSGFGGGSGAGKGAGSGAGKVSGKLSSGVGSRLGAGSGSVNAGLGSGLVAPKLGSSSGSLSPSKSSSGSGLGWDRIKEQVKQYNQDGYFYRYLTEQESQIAESGRIENRDTDNELLRAKGFYEYVGTDGVKYRVDYTADENGFVPQGAHLPTPPPIPEAILRALEYVRKLQQ